jgi:octaprenyl-diphosphate synthase
MDSLSGIRKTVENDLDAINTLLRGSLTTSVTLLNKILRYTVRSKGKQMRPLFVLLSAGACGGIRPSTHTAAVLIELLHSATLVHDDVVDDSHMRRGMFSVNALWKNKIAVLIGDFLLSRGLLTALENQEYRMLHIMSDAVRDMAEGELLQIEKARSLNIDEAVYFEIIRKKTASLIAACCATGAYSAGASEEVVARMKHFGELAGIAFQIRDDLFDFNRKNAAGKPAGVDLKERKLSLPVIHLLKHLPPAERRNLVSAIRRHYNNPVRVAEISARVAAGEGMSYAETKMQEYAAAAISELQHLPESAFRAKLEALVKYSIDRKK